MTLATVGRPVRFPFRILAGFIVAAGTFAGVATPIMLYEHVPTVSPLESLLTLPLIAGFVRICWCVAAEGTVPTNYDWPFATRNVACVYIFILFAYHWLN